MQESEDRNRPYSKYVHAKRSNRCILMEPIAVRWPSQGRNLLLPRGGKKLTSLLCIHFLQLLHIMNGNEHVRAEAECLAAWR
jgi:hypothetical protein